MAGKKKRKKNRGLLLFALIDIVVMIGILLGIAAVMQKNQLTISGSTNAGAEAISEQAEIASASGQQNTDAGEIYLKTSGVDTGSSSANEPVGADGNVSGTYPGENAAGDGENVSGTNEAGSTAVIVLSTDGIAAGTEGAVLSTDGTTAGTENAVLSTDGIAAGTEGAALGTAGTEEGTGVMLQSDSAETESSGLAAEETIGSADLAVMSSAELITESSLESLAELMTSGLESAEITESNPYADLPPTKRCSVDGTFWEGCPERDIQLLTPNPYSRPQYALEEVHDIVIHYVGNEGSTAQQNRDYFESLQDGSRSASSHFVVGLEGEIIQCIPCSEWSYASNDRNYDTISIECCHPDETGKFTDDTYSSVVNLTAWLCKAFQIGPEHVIRHYDVTGKDCPLYFVEHPEAWEQFKQDVADRYYEITAQ